MIRQRSARLTLAIAIALLAVLMVPEVAQASGILGTGIGPNVGPDLNPLPSIGSLLHQIIGGLFGALLEALTPSFLRNADIHTLQWLVQLPDPADTRLWPHVGELEGDMTWVAGALLPTMLVAGTVRDSLLSLAFRGSPGNALLRFVGAVFWIVLYRFAVNNMMGFVNVLTQAILSFPVVGEGLHRTVLVLFAGSVLAGVGGAFVALLALVAVVFAVSMFALKVALLSVLAGLYVVGPLFIALTPLPVLGYLARGWLLAFTGLCAIPLGWCVVFATAGALTLDVTSLSGGAHIGARVTGAFAALGTFYLAYKWPLLVLGHVRGALIGLAGPGSASGVRGGGGGRLSDRALAAKAKVARSRLQAALLTGGQGLSSAAGQLGAPAGGLAGIAKRRIRPRPRPQSSGATPSPARRGPLRQRLRDAAGELHQTPARMRHAWQQRHTPNHRSTPSSGRRSPRRMPQSRANRARNTRSPVTGSASTARGTQAGGPGARTATGAPPPRNPTTSTSASTGGLAAGTSTRRSPRRPRPAVTQTAARTGPPRATPAPRSLSTSLPYPKRPRQASTPRPSRPTTSSTQWRTPVKAPRQKR